jgi:predicted amidohydrolase YtcJ
MRADRSAGFLLLLSLAGCGGVDDVAGQQQADVVFLNGPVYTVDASHSWARAVAVRDGEIVYVGDDAGADAFVTSQTRVVDLQGRMLLPGFHDSHAHILIGANSEDECDLAASATTEALLDAVEACTQLQGRGPDSWVYGEGWGEWLFPGANPHKEILDHLFPDRPVFLQSSYAHSAWVNSRALELAAIDAQTPDPPQGVIVRDPETGEPTGTLREAAMMLVKGLLAPLSLEERVRRVATTQSLAHANGITAVIEPGVDDSYLEPITALADRNGLAMRVVASLSPLNFQSGAFDERVFDYLEERDRWRRANIDVDSVKVYMDGVIEFGTSPLLEPYLDGAHGSGEDHFFYAQDVLDEYFRRFDAMGLQIHVHAIGDAAVRRALNGFAAMRAANGLSDNRHQIVHLQLIHPDDRPRFAELDIGAVFQSLWAWPAPDIMNLTVPLIGKERAWQMYPIRTIRELGGRVVGGSDYDVTDMNPLLAIETAITRQNPWKNEGPALNEDERVDLATMIAAYTINGAYQMKLDQVQGSIEVGKRADLVVLDRNLFEISASEISEARVEMTFFDGRSVYEYPGNE